MTNYNGSDWKLSNILDDIDKRLTHLENMPIIQLSEPQRSEQTIRWGEEQIQSYNAKRQPLVKDFVPDEVMTWLNSIADDCAPAGSLHWLAAEIKERLGDKAELDLDEVLYMERALPRMFLCGLIEPYCDYGTSEQPLDIREAARKIWQHLMSEQAEDEGRMGY